MEESLITEEQWERIISWHRKRSGKEVVQGLVAAKEFSNAMERIQALAGTAQAELEEINQSILDMASEDKSSMDAEQQEQMPVWVQQNYACRIMWKQDAMWRESAAAVKENDTE